MLHHQAIHPSPESSALPRVPLIFMPASADGSTAMFDRLVEAAQTNLAFPALLVAPDLAEPNAIEAWPEALAELAAQHELTQRGLVLGHGAGARHAQHFVLQNPDAVIACAALSADDWAALEGVADPAALAGVQWLIGCGTDEPGGAMRRAEQLQVELAEAGCGVDFLDWDGDTADLPQHALENALRFFNDLQGQAKQAA